VSAFSHLRWALLGPPGPVIISALVVTGFALPHWLAPGFASPPEQGVNLACRVSRIVDGDTVVVDCPHGLLRVRIWGIDAPEMGQEPWGYQSRQHLESLLRNRRVLIQVEDLDKYGRVVARLQQGTVDLGLRMVRDGQASVRSRYVRDQNYRATRAQARVNGVGIWSQTGSQQQPWAWRRLNPPSPSKP
jgi:endonuclease YncB( thermonuclease family)